MRVFKVAATRLAARSKLSSMDAFSAAERAVQCALDVGQHLVRGSGRQLRQWAFSRALMSAPGLTRSSSLATDSYQLSRSEAASCGRAALGRRCTIAGNSIC